MRKFAAQSRYSGQPAVVSSVHFREASNEVRNSFGGSGDRRHCSVGSGPAMADANWWPAKYYNLDSGSPKVAEYTPLEKASKPWNICVLFPHMKDTFWVAVDYGVVEEAKRMGVNMTLYQAGGYENLPKQLSQFDDCLSGNFDAIVIGPISEAGLDKQFAKGVASGKPII